MTKVEFSSAKVVKDATLVQRHRINREKPKTEKADKTVYKHDYDTSKRPDEFDVHSEIKSFQKGTVVSDRQWSVGHEKIEKPELDNENRHGQFSKYHKHFDKENQVRVQIGFKAACSFQFKDGHVRRRLRVVDQDGKVYGELAINVIEGPPKVYGTPLPIDIDHMEVSRRVPQPLKNHKKKPATETYMTSVSHRIRRNSIGDTVSDSTGSTDVFTDYKDKVRAPAYHARVIQEGRSNHQQKVTKIDTRRDFVRVPKSKRLSRGKLTSRRDGSKVVNNVTRLMYENEEKTKDKKRRRKRAILVKDQKQGKDIPLDEALEKGLVTADQAIYLKKAILNQ